MNAHQRRIKRRKEEQGLAAYLAAYDHGEPGDGPRCVRCGWASDGYLLCQMCEEEDLEEQDSEPWEDEW